MDIGRKIYYELATGNVIVETGERSGDVVETTEAQDFQMYAALQPYQQSAVGCLQLNFGDFDQNFGTYPYSVDITQNPPTIAWDTANPIGATLADVQTSKIAQLRSMYGQTLAAGFTSNATGTATTFGWSQQDQIDLGLIQQDVDKGIKAFPFEYADVNGNSVSISSQTILTQIDTDANNFETAQFGQLHTLITQVQSATTTEAVNAIQWTPGAYTPQPVPTTTTS